MERDAHRSFEAREIVIRVEYRHCPNLVLVDTPGLVGDVTAADEADAFAYRLTGGTYAVDAAYDGAGEAIITLTLSRGDAGGGKMAGGEVVQSAIRRTVRVP